MSNRVPRYIALSEVNMDFTPRELEAFDYLIDEGYDISDIASYLKRNQLEVFLLYLDRLWNEQIEPMYTLRRIQKGAKKKMIVYMLRNEEHREFKTTDPHNVTTAILNEGYRLVDSYEMAIVENPIKMTREEFQNEFRSPKFRDSQAESKSSERTDDEGCTVPSGGSSESNERDSIRCANGGGI